MAGKCCQQFAKLLILCNIPAICGNRLPGNGLANRTPSAKSFRAHSTPYVIPSVAEESENPAVDSISGFSDSSATLGMTSFNKFRMSGKGAAIRDGNY